MSDDTDRELSALLHSRFYSLFFSNPRVHRKRQRIERSPLVCVYINGYFGIAWINTNSAVYGMLWRTHWPRSVNKNIYTCTRSYRSVSVRVVMEKSKKKNKNRQKNTEFPAYIFGTNAGARRVFLVKSITSTRLPPSGRITATRQPPSTSYRQGEEGGGDGAIKEKWEYERRRRRST